MNIMIKLIPVIRMTKHIGLILSLGAALLYFNGCSENSTNTTVPANKAMVVATTSMAPGTVSATSIPASKGDAIQDAVHSVADSIIVTRARIVLKDLKLHRIDSDVDTLKDDDKDHDGDKDDEDEDEGEVKVGPFIAVFDASGEHIISEVMIPPGTYDRIKFEIHKLNENEDMALLNDSLFGDFVNGGRYTVIIDGWSYVGGKKYAFTYKSSLTTNVEVAIDSGARFDSTKSYNLTLVFDPKIVFGRPGAPPYDPRDPDNHEAIDRLLARAIRSLRVPR